MQALKVTSIGSHGEHTINHLLWDCDYQDAIIVATLRGVLEAGQTIKSFEIVEV